MMGAGPGNLKVVNVVASCDGEGGLSIGLGGRVTADDIPLGDKAVVNMIAPPVNCADALTKPSVHMITPRPIGSPLSVMRASRPHLRSSLAPDAGAGTPLLPYFSVSPIADAPSAQAPLQYCDDDYFLPAVYFDEGQVTHI